MFYELNLTLRKLSRQPLAATFFKFLFSLRKIDLPRIINANFQVPFVHWLRESCILTPPSLCMIFRHLEVLIAKFLNLFDTGAKNRLFLYLWGFVLTSKKFAETTPFVNFISKVVSWLPCNILIKNKVDYSCIFKWCFFLSLNLTLNTPVRN